LLSWVKGTNDESFQGKRRVSQWFTRERKKMWVNKTYKHMGIKSGSKSPVVKCDDSIFKLKWTKGGYEAKGMCSIGEHYV